ncbi:Multicopper oxidase [Phytophthora cactorum]|nr:Multicopper oxidase [Phytophthora cactorum]
MAAMAPFEFSVDDHEFQIIAADGEPVQPTELINAIFINAGQRYDIVVQAKNDTQGADSFWMRAKGLSGLPWMARSADTGLPGFNDEGLAIVRYNAASTSEPTTQKCEEIVTVNEFDFTPDTVAVLPTVPADRSIIQFNISAAGGVISLDGGEYYSLAIPDEPPLLTISNGSTTADLPITANARAIEYGKHVEVVLVNSMNEQHPFHLHSHAPWVVSSGQAAAEDIYSNNLPPLKLQGAMVRDVYTVPPCDTDDNNYCINLGYLILRFTADNPGVWMMHCHIDWHMDIGLSMIFVEGEKELQQKGPNAFSSSLLSVCKKESASGLPATLAALLSVQVSVQLGHTNAAVVAYDWHLTPIQTAFDGVMLQTLGINDKSSHEAHIKIELGQEVEVHVTNELSEPTCLHWHGMKQLGTQEMDGMSGFTQCAIEPNRSATYRYTPDKAGTFWWHSHHGTQYAYGLRGPLTVHAPESETQSWNEEYTIQMADIYHTPPPPGPVLWDSIVVNNLGRYDCTAAAIHNLTDCESHQPLSSFDFQPGKKYLLRLINMAAMATFEFSIDGHEFQVIAADAEPVVPTDLINSIIVNVGQRYDVVVQAKEDTEGVGSFWMRVKGLTGYPWTARAADTGTVGFSDEGLAIIRYDSGSRSEPTSEKAKETKTIGEFDFTSATLEVLPATPDDRSTMRFNINTTIGTGIVSLEDGEFQTMIVPDQPPLLSIASGLTTADLPISANARAIEYGKHIEVVLMNDVIEQHPFHLHSHVAWVVGSGHVSAEEVYNNKLPPLNLNGPILRDVYTVPACDIDEKGLCVNVGYVVLRFKADNPGVWMVHCHVDWHMAIGMGVIFVEGEAELREKGPDAFSSSLLSVCKHAPSNELGGSKLDGSTPSEPKVYDLPTKPNSVFCSVGN